ncbi:MAG: cobyrinic acid a,c-diamide synthase, partial [Rhizobiaceae bacterium]
GLMYMARSIAYGGRQDQMVGAIPADAVMMDRPQGRGLALLSPAGASPGETIPAHEFHHARLVGLPDDAEFAWRVLRGDGIDGRHDGVMVDNLVAGFCHLRDTSRFRWADTFVEQVRRRKTQTGSRRVNN